MSALATLARMLGVAPRLAEDAMHSERAAKASLSRRNLLAAAGAMATGAMFCPSVELVRPCWRPPETLMPLVGVWNMVAMLASVHESTTRGYGNELEFLKQARQVLP